MKIVLWLFCFIEIIAISYSIYGFFDFILNKSKKKYEIILDKCANDVQYRNKVASYIFFFQDMGPNISSFSIISIFITDRENTAVLLVIFFIGIIIKEESRKLKNLFYDEIAKRNQKCQLE
jgi:hypothetical protein